MNGVIIISGPIGAGKSTVARELIPSLTGLVACIEGDKFWPFIAKSEHRDPRENGHLIMRSMTAATIPFVRSGFKVLLDFSIPPHFLIVARKILKDLPLSYVILRPSESVCALRASRRKDGAIADYSEYSEFYRLFDEYPQYRVADDHQDAAQVATHVLNGLKDGKFTVP